MTKLDCLKPVGRLVMPGVFLVASALSGCTESGSASRIGAAAEGFACKQVSDCAAGLDCVSDVCTPLPPLATGPQRGDPCTTPTDCGTELFCGRQGVCTVNAPLNAGDPCGLTIECAAPLVCDGLTGVCKTDDGQPGTLDFGEECLTLFDCQRPYICGLDGTCARLPFNPGPSCTRSNAEAGAFRVYFEVPPATPGPDFEFYRLPFPNDLRVTAGHVSLAGHPAPASGLGIDIGSAYFTAIEQDVVGFAVNQPIFFRFSDVLDYRSVCLDPGSSYPGLDDPAAEPYCKDNGSASVYLVDIDPDSPAYNTRVPVQMKMSRERGQYICQNWLGVAPLDGRPLRHSTTYAAIVTTAMRDLRGAAPIRDKDFRDFMDGALSLPAMQPLKDWISAESVDANGIAAAAVFTTGDPSAIAPKLRAAVQARPAPAFDNNTVECGTISPCDDGLPLLLHQRGCFGDQVGFHEIQGTYSSPAFQSGQRPYATTDKGGAFALDANGTPEWQADEKICYAAALPDGAPPAGGFPVIIYGHGTGGTYRSFVDEGLAARFTALGYAVLGFDNVMHGRRQQQPGATPDPLTWSPDPGGLFFNLANPRASRDNVLQGAADLFHLVRLVSTASLATPLAAPLDSIQFNANKVFYLGHSQGTVIAPAFLAAEPDLRAAVLSGAGAELALTILNKKQPTDVSVAAGAFFGDQNLGRIHPMMGLIAMLFGPADAIAFAPTWVTSSSPRGAALPLLQFTGIADSYTPDVTQHAQLRAAGLPLVGPVEIAVDGVAQLSSPRSANLNGVTAGAVQFRPDGDYDGHFIMFEHPTAKACLDHFLSTAKDGVAEIKNP